MARSPMARISRCTRFRLTGIPRRSSQAFIRLGPKKGVSRYCRSISPIRDRSSAEAARGR